MRGPQRFPPQQQPQHEYGGRRPSMDDYGSQGAAVSPPFSPPVRSYTQPPQQPQHQQQDPNGYGYGNRQPPMPQQQQQQQWQEPGPAAGYHGPDSPTYIPPRPATAGAGARRPNGFAPHGGQQGHPPPMPPPHQQQQYQPGGAPHYQQQYQQPYAPQGGAPPPQPQWGDQRSASLGDVYDGYYGGDGGQQQHQQQQQQLYGAPGAYPPRQGSRDDAAIEAEMPDFDSVPSGASGGGGGGGGRGGHRRGNTLERDLAAGGIMSPPGQGQGQQQQQYGNEAPGGYGGGGNDFGQVAHKSRSQPDLRGQNNGSTGSNDVVFEMPGDIPDVPPMPTTASASAGSEYGGAPRQMPNSRQGPGPAMGMGMGAGAGAGMGMGAGMGPGPGPGPGPGRGMAPPGSGPMGGPRGPPPPNGMDSRGVPAQRSATGPPRQQMYPPGQRPPPSDAQFQQRPPAVRNQSAATQWSDPGPNPRTNLTSPREPQTYSAPAGNNGLPNGPAPQPGQQRPGIPERRSNPDALPHHPVPVRPGLNPSQLAQTPSVGSMQPAKPPPIRQYNNANDAAGPGPQGGAAPAGEGRARRRDSQPVTQAELESLRQAVKANKEDHKLGLRLVKKLVEASVVLADDGGRADVRTRNKNRERFVFEAHKVLKKLVAGGFPEAMFYMADCHGQGQLGLEVDQKEAFSLYQSAAKLGHAPSAYRTAVCCEMGAEEGGGTRRDPLKAVQWYKRAAALGDTPAMYKMGMILLKGLLGQQQNVGEALIWLKRAAERADEDNPHALHELALLYEAPTNGDKIIRDEGYALALFGRAADLGYKFSQFRLAQAFEYGLLGCRMDARTSIAWYARAARQEEHQSELALSGWYLTGCQGILEQSDTEAYLWARKAACAEPPLPKAMFAMGYFTEVGIGCPRSLEEAKRWYGRAAAYKFPKAQERLDELKRGGVKVQKNRERLSRSNQKQHEDCVVM
ncbi:hypothetical protein BDY21DRAFT_327563 [Lineolata rhizophorae]|uniref:HCP-like protein n=1 Tax=Lineolata rhizophorae TaxID=578093 RepID=A0A6A6NP07_9PEZI|nr:hypothetical protein BDY21DRAFT_327563 [Lineolata rhizophorae]